jgi:hypothetical protein
MLMSPDCQDARHVHSALSTWERRLSDEVSRLTRKVEAHSERNAGLDSQASVAALEGAAERLAEVQLSLHEIETSCGSATRLACRLPASERSVAILVPSPRTDPAPRPRLAPRLRWAGSPLDDIFRRGAAHEPADDLPDASPGPPLYGAHGAPVGPALSPFSSDLSVARERMSATGRDGDAAAQGRATRRLSRAAAARSPILAHAATVRVPVWAEDDVVRKLVF